MAISKRAIVKKYNLLPILAILLLVSLTLAGKQIVGDAVSRFESQGPERLSQRLSTILARRVEIGALELALPANLTIRNLAIFERDSKSLFLTTPELRIQLSIPALLTARLRPQSLQFITPEMQIYRISSQTFNFGDQQTAARITARAGLEQQGWPNLLHPLTWPLELTADRVEILRGSGHLEDDLDALPQMDGSFSLTLTRQGSENFLQIRQAELTVHKARFFHRGVQGTAGGVLRRHGERLDVELDLELTRGRMQLKAQARNLAAAPDIRFQLSGKDLYLNDLALSRPPLVDLPRDATAFGQVSLTSPRFLNSRFASLAATMQYGPQGWQADGVMLKLPQGRGEISGAISRHPDMPSQGVAKFAYQGPALPALTVSPTLAPVLGDTFGAPPLELSGETTIDYSSYPIRAHGVRLTSSWGAIFAQGVMEFFSGFLELHGTFMKPGQSLQGSSLTPIRLTGSLERPELLEGKGNLPQEAR